jgi:hypothetical protein
MNLIEHSETFSPILPLSAGATQRRVPRVDTRTSLCKAALTFPSLSTFRMQIESLSTLGARFRVPGKHFAGMLTHEVAALLHLGPFVFDLKSRIHSQTEQHAVCEFIEPHPMLGTLVRELFHLEMVAAELKPEAAQGVASFADARGNSLKLHVGSRSLEAIQGTIQPLAMTFVWQAGCASELRIGGWDAHPLDGITARSGLINVINNLPRLHSSIRRSAIQGLASVSRVLSTVMKAA